MSFLKRKQTDDTNAPNGDADPSLQDADRLADHASSAGKLASRETLDSGLDFEHEMHALLSDAVAAQSHWRSAALTVTNYNFGNATDSIVAISEDVVARPGERVTVGRRRNSVLEADAVKTSVISARLTARHRAGLISEEPQPLIHGFNETNVAEENMPIVNAMKRLEGLVEGDFYKAEHFRKKVIERVATLVGDDPANLEEFLSWIRTASVDASEFVPILEILANDLLDPNSQQLIGNVLRDLDRGHDDISIREKFAEVLSSDDRDKEYKPAIEVISFLQSALVSMGYAEVPPELVDVIRHVEPDKWPKPLLDAFNSFSINYRKEIKDLLMSSLSPFARPFQKNPTIVDLKALERQYLFQDIEQDRKEIKGKQPARVRVSDDFTATADAPEKARPLADVQLARVMTTNGSRTIELEAVEDPEGSIVEAYVKEYRLDASEAEVMREDIRKMLAALRVKATGVIGTTPLSEVRPYQTGVGKNSVQVWRLNPVRYTGLSVSTRGKGTRIIYCVTKDRVLGILGVYPHDDYERAIERLR